MSVSRLRPNPLLTLMLALALALGASAVHAASEVSGPAPDFTLKSNSGQNLKLSEMRGQVVMINFWASWCAPCRQEMPLLDGLHQRYEPLGFTVLGVNVEEDSSKADSLLKQIPVTFPILYDNRNSVSKLYDVKAMPTTVLVDRNGNMRFLHKGYKPGYEVAYEEHIRALVRE
jgi:thiol-disulfide isomerase/thioredoxin